MENATMTTGTTRVDLTVRSFSVEITATTSVPAPAHQVWAVLADTSSYPQWNPFVRRLTGDLHSGARLEVVLQPADRPQTMRPRVVQADVGRGFTWLGHVLVPGVLDGRHTFTVDPVDEASAVLLQHERLSGLLVPFFRRMLTEDTPRAFAALNDALAARVAVMRPDTP
jgi:hypothetical protein